MPDPIYKKINKRKKRQKRKPRYRSPELSIKLILTWADTHHTQWGRWPVAHSGRIPETMDETWLRVDCALRRGSRGLPGGSSLARFLADQRGARNRTSLPTLTEAQILTWADSHHERTGYWPNQTAGPVLDARGETWVGLDLALARGNRGLPGGQTLAGLLARERGLRHQNNLPPLSIEQILEWADEHFARTGDWPSRRTPGTLPGPAHDTWLLIDCSLPGTARPAKRPVPCPAARGTQRTSQQA